MDELLTMQLEHSKSLLDEKRQQACLQQLPHWRKVAGEVEYLECVFRFADFSGAMRFANRVAELADAADHHPALLVEWGRVTVRWWTHSLHGLHLNDFIMAARTGKVYPGNT